MAFILVARVQDNGSGLATVQRCPPSLSNLEFRAGTILPQGQWERRAPEFGRGTEHSVPELILGSGPVQILFYVINLSWVTARRRHLADRSDEFLCLQFDCVFLVR